MKTIKNLTADEIRKSILQLAIQGKLVKQDSNDEPASELVKRIYEEKHRLIKEGKIKKDKNESYIYKGDDNCYYEKIGKETICIDKELPFEIPYNWTWVRLQNLIKIFDKSPYKASFGEDKGLFPFYTSSQELKKYCNTAIFENGITMGTGGKGSVNICQGKFSTSTDCLNFSSLHIKLEYLYIFLLCNIDYISKSMFKGVGLKHLQKDQLFHELVPVPPLQEQKRIVTKIQDFEPLIQKYEQQENLLSNLESSFEDKLKASILQYAIEGKLVKQDPNDEPASVLLERIKAEKDKLIKEGKIKHDKHESEIVIGDKNYYQNQWVYAKLKSFLIPNKNGLPATKYIKYIDIDSIDNKKHEIKSYKLIKAETATPRARRILMEGDILYSIVRPYLENIAKVTKDYSNCIGSTGFYICRPIKYLTTDFLFIILLSPYFKSKVMPHMKGDNSPSITSKVLEEIQIAIPSLAQQKKINLKVAEIMSILG